VAIIGVFLFCCGCETVHACDFASATARAAAGAAGVNPHHHHHRHLQQQEPTTTNTTTTNATTTTAVEGQGASVSIVTDDDLVDADSDTGDDAILSEPGSTSNTTADINSTIVTDAVLDDLEEAPTTTTTDEEEESTCIVDSAASSALRNRSVLDLTMMARQTRGRISVQNNCQFQVDRLEVFVSSSDNNENATLQLDWYAAVSLEEDDVNNRTLLATGGSFVQSDLMGNTTALEIDALYDLSQVGAILLCERMVVGDNNETSTTRVLASALLQKLKPGPANGLITDPTTYFDICLSLSETIRLRWTLSETFIDIGLEYTTSEPANTWMAFGPAAPGIEDRLMGGSDVVLAGFRLEDDTDDEEDADALPFAEDYYIGGYEVCTKLVYGEAETAAIALGIDADNDSWNYTHDGVCRDTVWLGTDNENQDDDNNGLLQYSHVLEGVAFLRIRRPLAAANPDLDHPILPGMQQHFVWARGPLDPSQGIAEVQFHGYQNGQLKSIDVNEPMWSCPPLEGVQLEGEDDSDALLDDVDYSNDPFAKKFEHATVLQGNVVEFFWTLLPETSQIYMGARAIAGSSSKWMSVAVGDSMTDAWAWVATWDDEDAPALLGYRMSGLDATTVRLVSGDEETAMLSSDAMQNILSRDDNGRLSFEVTAQWPLPGMKEGDTAVPLIWALGPSWRGPSDGSTSPRREDEHSTRSKAPTTVDFATGAAQVGSGTTNSILLAHAILMWLAWLVMAPLTAIASRYIRNDPCLADSSSWIQLHKRGAAAVMALSLVGLALAVAGVSKTGLPHIVSAHAKVGIALLSMMVVQNGFGVLRPDADVLPLEGVQVFGIIWTKRRVWSWSHRVLAITMLSVAVAVVITGSTSLEGLDSRVRYGVPLSIAWIVLVAFILAVYELRRAGIASSPQSPEAAPAAPDNEPNEEEPKDYGSLDAEEPATTEPKSTLETSKPSPWTFNWLTVYAGPSAFAIAVLVVLAAVAFSGTPDYESQMMESSAVTSGSLESSSQDSTDPSSDIAAAAPPYNPTASASVDIPEDCAAFPAPYVGDGWCDDHEPFNTAACGWDGGDCCNVNLGLYNCRDPASTNFGKSSSQGWAAPLSISRNPRYTVTREESLESFVISYNNYYEFGFSKDIAEEATKHADFLGPDNWYVDISGLVENPMTVDVTSLVSQMQLEERMYRHRCVEAWSITVPWVGFPLTKLLDMVKPKPDAAIIQFVSWKNTTHSKTQGSGSYPWPYTEALTMDEARNELAMFSVGAFGKPLTAQQGAPIRLTVPWKYGFKSIKSIEKITFLADDEYASRRTFWSEVNPNEYGFFANVNPEVPHRRWSQATERHYVEGYPGTRLDTTRMNGYQAQVDYLYENIEDTAIYF